MNWLGDLARAYRSAGAVTDADRASIAAMLGLERFTRRADGPAQTPRDPMPALSPAADRTPEVPGTTDPENPPASAAPGSAPPPRLADHGNPPIGVVGHHPALLESMDGPGFGHPGARLDHHVPLLPPASSRAVLEALIAQVSSGGPIDIDALVHAAATRRLTSLPRRSVRSLRQGVQVLVDEGAGMAPFVRDQDHVVEQVRRLAGDYATEVRHFADSPLRGSGTGPIWTWRSPYRPPAPGSAILVLSDLGIGANRLDPMVGTRAEWQSFAELTRDFGCPVIALVPYPRYRFPPWFATLFTVVTWDRTLTAGRASRARE